MARICEKGRRYAGCLAFCGFMLAVAAFLVCALCLREAPVAYGVALVPASSDALGSRSVENASVTDASTPRIKDEAGLRWAVKFDDGYVSPELIVGDEVVVTSGRGSKGKITKLDKKTGEIVAQADMHNASAYSLVPPTYGDGKIFVTLSGGGLEAFDAKTLKSLWYFKDELGGQGNCPVVYSDGRVYTGYWNGETAGGNYVCVDAQAGKLVWKEPSKGGYYWAGALAVDNYLLFCSDDGKPAGEAGYSLITSCNKATGDMISAFAIEGDLRSGVAFDPDSGRIFFTSKTGHLYSLWLDRSDGNLYDLKSVKIGTESTATPVVYDGRVYVGASSGGFSGGTLSVVDAKTTELLYQLDGSSGIGGAVKSTPLVSTAYLGESGKLRLYFTVNYPPGGITMVSVEPASTEASQASVTALFTPPEELRQYCIASVVCDEEGNLYYRNDSNYLMCVGRGGVDPEKYKVSSGPNSGGNGGSSTPQGNGGSSSGNGGSNGQGSSSSSSSSGGNESGRRGGPIQRGGAPGGSAGGAGGMGAQNSVDSGGDGAAAASGGKEAVAQSDNARHTDATAATERLNDEIAQSVPAWLVPAIVAAVALLALIAVLVMRVVGNHGR